MIKFETMVGGISVGMESTQSNNDAFFNVTDKKHATKANEIVAQGIYYGYIKVLIDGEEQFGQYQLQIVAAQWLRYIELFEQFFEKGYVQAEVPSYLEVKRIDDETLSFHIKDSLFVFSYVEFIKQFIHDALEYFIYHQQVTNDGMYEDVVAYLRQWQSKLYLAE
ncbi:hypothetical protein NSQ62_03470 [Solibacillus sp. FSL H8-0523]|uniref:hypothetical protein n=1 Tax=Solibacillus sp. FSL H8-0523 TaxID=2954511 RepID=UPI00310103EE